MSWLSGWTYRSAFKIALASGGPLTDYTVVVSIDTTGLIADGKMQSDGDDIRFTQGATETLLSYWLEPGTINTTTTKIWIKINTIPNGNSGIWMYYGNPSASATSDISGIFLDYDLFDDGTIDPGKWTTLSGNGAITESGGQLSFAYTTTEANDWWSSGREGEALRLDAIPGVDFFAEILIPSGKTSPELYHFGIAAYEDDSNVYLFGYGATFDRLVLSKVVGGTGSSVGGSNGKTLPRYYGIKKIGSQFSFWHSVDGASWTKAWSDYSDITFNNVVLFGREWSASGTNLTFNIKNFRITKLAAVEPTITFMTKNIKVHGGATAALNEYWQDGPNPFFYEDSTNIIYLVVTPGTSGYLDAVKSIDEGITFNTFLTLSDPPSLPGSVYRTPSGNEWQLKNNKIYGVVANAAENLILCFYLINLTSETEERKTEIFYEGFNPGMFPRQGIGFTITDDGKLWASYTWFGFTDTTYPGDTILVVNSEDEGQTWGISLQINVTGGGRGNTKLFSETNAVVLIHNWNLTGDQGIYKSYAAGVGSNQTFLSGAVDLRDVVQYGTSYIYSYQDSSNDWYTGIDLVSGIQIGSGEGPIMLAIDQNGDAIAITKTSATQLSEWKWNGSGWDLITAYTKTSTDNNGDAIGDIGHAYLLYHQYDSTKQGEGKELFYTGIPPPAKPPIYALYEASLWSFFPEVSSQGPRRPLFAPCAPDPDVIPRPVLWPFNGSQSGLLALDLAKKAGVRQKQFGGPKWDRSGMISFKSYQKYGQLFLEGAFAAINTPNDLYYPDGSEPTARPYGADIWRFYKDRKGSLLPFFMPEFFPRPHLKLTSATLAGATTINLASVVGLTIEDGAEGNFLAVSRPERNIFDVVGITTIAGLNVGLINPLSYSYETSADIFVAHKVIFDQPLKVRQVHRFVDYFEMRFRAVGTCRR